METVTHGWTWTLTSQSAETKKLNSCVFTCRRLMSSSCLLQGIPFILSRGQSAGHPAHSTLTICQRDCWSCSCLCGDSNPLRFHLSSMTTMVNPHPSPQIQLFKMGFLVAGRSLLNVLGLPLKRHKSKSPQQVSFTASEQLFKRFLMESAPRLERKPLKKLYKYRKKDCTLRVFIDMYIIFLLYLTNTRKIHVKSLIVHMTYI